MTDNRFVVYVTTQNGDHVTVKHAGSVKTLKALCNTLKVRHNPRLIEVSDLRAKRTMSFSF